MMKVFALSADTARARIYVYDPVTVDEDEQPTLVEVETLVNPGSRATDSEYFSNSRPGLRGGAGTQGHAVDDHRAMHRETQARRFAADVVNQAKNLIERTGAGRLVVFAAPGMLGYLRKEIAGHAKPPWTECVEHAVDVTRSTAPELHDRMTKHELLPKRWQPERRGPSRKTIR